jgi:mRNA interferase RelE/StbE
MREWNVRITPTAVDMILGISDPRVQRAIRDRIRALDHDPELQGKPLIGALQGFYRIKVLDRYRVLYSLHRDTVTVHVVAAGIRKEGDKRDIYSLAQRLVKLGLLATAEDE